MNKKTPSLIPIAIVIGIIILVIAILFLAKPGGTASVSVADSMVVQDEGSALTQRDTINFIGPYVTCVDNVGNTRSDCTWITPTPQTGGSAHVIEDEGVPLTQRDNLNFVGDLVTCADNNPDTTCTVINPTAQPTATIVPTATPQSGLGSHTIEDEGTPLPDRDNLDFIGDLITCVDNNPDTSCTVANPTPVATSTPQPTPTAQPAYNTIEDEGVGLTQRDTANFIGDLVTCADNVSVTDCTITNPTPQPTATLVSTSTPQPTSTPLPEGNVRYITYIAENPAATDSFLISKLPFAITITDIECIVDPGDTAESAVIEVFETNGTGDSPTTIDAPITCDNDGAADDGTLTNANVDAGDWLQIDTGTITGTVTQVVITITYTIP